jgi:hypothetical protein
MTVIETATPECAGASGLSAGKACAGRAIPFTASRGVPATRELESTLWGVLGIAGVAIAAGALVEPQAVRDTVARFEQAGCDELVLFPCNPDPAQVEALAEVVR